MDEQHKYGVINSVFCKESKYQFFLSLIVDCYFGEQSFLLAEPYSTVKNTAVHKGGKLIVRSGAVAVDLIVPNGFCLEVTKAGTEWHGCTPTDNDFIVIDNIRDWMATKLVRVNAENKAADVRHANDIKCLIHRGVLFKDIDIVCNNGCNEGGGICHPSCKTNNMAEIAEKELADFEAMPDEKKEGGKA